MRSGTDTPKVPLGKVVECINEIVGDEFRSEKLPEYQSFLQGRMAALEGELETEKLQAAMLERDRQNKLQFMSESNSRVLNRAREVLGMVENVNRQVSDIVARTIKLDRAQRNLTIIITLLERFKGFVDNIDRLEKLLINREFNRIASLLLATQQFAEQFSKAKDTKLADEQVNRFNYLQKMIQRQVLDTFECTMKRRGSISPSETINLAHAAIILDVLGEEARDGLVRWYCGRQLGDYRDVFKGNKELNNLESIPKRYAWLKRLLIAYEAEHLMIFPETWRVDLALCLDFCTITCKDIAEFLEQQRGNNLDLVLLQASVQQTRQFELFLQRKFKVDRSSGLILSLAFEPYLSYFVEAHDKDLANYIDILPKKLSIGDFEASNVLASAPELFILFKEVLLNISDLSTKKPLGDLCVVFTKHLSLYAKYLERCLPNTINKKGLAQFEVKLICNLINTCDFCVVTVEQMEDRLKSLIDVKCQDEVQFDSSKQEFLVQLSIASSKLHQVITFSLESSWGAFNSIPWQNIITVGDHGDYINKIQRTLSELFHIRSTLIEVKHYVAICNRIVIGILKRFSESVQRIKPLTEIIAQQLLIDLEALRNCLMEMLRAGKYGFLRDSFQKLVVNESASTEKLLKCLLLQPEPVGFFVQNYIVIVTDGDENKFVKTLELRGVKKALYPSYLEEFRRLIPWKPSESTPNGKVKDFDFSKLNAQLKRIMTRLK